MRPSPILDTVVIAGVGLIGGSIGLGIRERFLAKRVIGLDKNPETLEAALGMGVVDEIKLSADSYLKQADLVILAAPVKANITLAKTIEPFLGKHTVITDVGGVKAEICKELAHLRFIGGHPMAGSEKSGVLNANAALLENAVWAITPNPDSDPAKISLIREFISHLGARPIRIEPEQHDRLVATISHVPYLTALALTQLIAEDKDRDLMMLLAAGGYRDLTRVASGDPIMSRDMVMGNKIAVKEAIVNLQARLEHIQNILEDPETLLENAKLAKQTRDSFPIVKRSLLPAKYEVVIAVPDKPGQLAIITSALGKAEVNIKDIEVLGIREQGGAVRIAFNDAPQQERGVQTLANEGYEVVTRK